MIEIIARRWAATNIWEWSQFVFDEVGEASLQEIQKIDVDAIAVEDMITKGQWRWRWSAT